MGKAGNANLGGAYSTLGFEFDPKGYEEYKKALEVLKRENPAAAARLEGMSRSAKYLSDALLKAQEQFRKYNEKLAAGANPTVTLLNHTQKAGEEIARYSQRLAGALSSINAFVAETNAQVIASANAKVAAEKLAEAEKQEAIAKTEVDSALKDNAALAQQAQEQVNKLAEAQKAQTQANSRVATDIPKLRQYYADLAAQIEETKSKIALLTEEYKKLKIQPNTNNAGVTGQVNAAIDQEKQKLIAFQQQLKATREELSLLGVQFNSNATIKFAENMINAYKPVENLNNKLKELVTQYNRLQTELNKQIKLFDNTKDLEVAVAYKQRISDITQQMAVLRTQIIQTTQAISGNTSTTTQNSSAQNNAANNVSKSTQKHQQHVNVIRQSTSALQSFTSGLQQMQGAANASGQTVLNSFISLPGAIIGATTALGALTAGLAGLGAIFIGTQASFKNTTFQVRDFANATGVNIKRAQEFNIVSKIVGKDVQDLGLSLAIFNQTIAQAGLDGAKNLTKVDQKLDDIAEKLAEINVDHLQKFNAILDDIDEKMSDAEVNMARNEEDYNRERLQASDDYHREKRQNEEETNRDLEELNYDHNNRIGDLNRDRNKAESDWATENAEHQIDLQKQIAKIEEEYSNKRLGLWDKYFSANPLLRPFIKSQIDYLGELEQTEIQAAQDEDALELRRLREKYDNEVEELQRKIDRENHEYQVQKEELLRRQVEHEEDLKRTYDRRTDDLDRTYTRQKDDYAELQKDLKKQTADRLLEEQENYNRAIEDLHESYQRLGDDIAANPVGGGFAAGLVDGLKKLNIDLSDFTKIWKEDPVKALDMLAKALAAFPEGAEKAAIIQQLYGFFGINLKPWIDFLGKSGNTVEKFQELFPHLVNPELWETAVKVNEKWSLVSLIFDDLVAAFTEALLPYSEDLADTILTLWENPTQRAQLVKDVQSIATEVGKIFTTIRDIITGKQTLGDVLGKALGALGGVFNTPEVKNTFKQLGVLIVEPIGEGARQGIRNIVQDLRVEFRLLSLDLLPYRGVEFVYGNEKLIREALDRTNQYFEQHKDELIGTEEQKSNIQKEKLKEYYRDIVSETRLTHSDLEGKWETFYTTVLDETGKSREAVVRNYTDQKGEVIQQVVLMKNEVSGKFSEILSDTRAKAEETKNAGVENFQALYAGALVPINELVDASGQIPERVKAEIIKNKQKAIDAGEEIARSFEEGWDNIFSQMMQSAGYDIGQMLEDLYFQNLNQNWPWQTPNQQIPNGGNVINGLPAGIQSINNSSSSSVNVTIDNININGKDGKAQADDFVAQLNQRMGARIR